eukprot:scaffold8649_cov82-Isochrysis_galbana.AAC.3
MERTRSGRRSSKDRRSRSQPPALVNAEVGDRSSAPPPVSPMAGKHGSHAAAIRGEGGGRRRWRGVGELEVSEQWQVVRGEALRWQLGSKSASRLRVRLGAGGAKAVRCVALLWAHRVFAG